MNDPTEKTATLERQMDTCAIFTGVALMLTVFTGSFWFLTATIVLWFSFKACVDALMWRADVMDALNKLRGARDRIYAHMPSQAGNYEVAMRLAERLVEDW
jgi:hypothetical protein